MDRANLSTGESHQYCVRSTGGPLTVTLAWHDYPASVSAAKALVNDLDLSIRAAGLNGFPLLVGGPARHVTWEGAAGETWRSVCVCVCVCVCVSVLCVQRLPPPLSLSLSFSVFVCLFPCPCLWGVYISVCMCFTPSQATNTVAEEVGKGWGEVCTGQHRCRGWVNSFVATSNVASSFSMF